MGSEGRAAQLFQQGQYSDALQAYTTCINKFTPSTRLDIRINLLFNRSACYLKLKKFDKVVADCTTILSLEASNNKALSRKIKALCSLGHFSEAQMLGRQWMIREPQNLKARMELERINTIVKALQDQQDGDEDGLEPAMSVAGERVPPEGREDDSTNQSPNTAISQSPVLLAAPAKPTPSLITNMQITNPIVSSLFSNPGLVTTTASSTNLMTTSSYNMPVTSACDVRTTTANGTSHLSLGGFPVTTVASSSPKAEVSSSNYDVVVTGSGGHALTTDLKPASTGSGANTVTMCVTTASSVSSNSAATSAAVNGIVSASGNTFTCSYCHVTCQSSREFKIHCAGDMHQQTLKLDSAKEWKHRPPPRGLTGQEYTKCPRNFGEGTCRFGDNCSQAHSEAELVEWKERFEHHKRIVQQAKQDDEQGNAYADNLLQRWMASDTKDTVMTDAIEGVHVHVNTELSVSMCSKKSSHMWLLTVTSRASLKKAALLDDANRKHFSLASITVGPKRSQKSQELLDQCQEWDNTSYSSAKTSNERVYRIKVVFRTDIYGTFRQSVVMDFGSDPVLVKQLCVASAPVADLEQLTQDLMLAESGRWDLTTKTVVPFEPKPGGPPMESEKDLLENYPAPMASKFIMSQCLMEPEVTLENYRTRMHHVLFIEEMAQFSSIARYNVKATLQLVSCFLLVPSTGGSAKFAQNGELFARMKLSSDLSEDTAHGRLILQNVQMVYVAPCGPGAKADEEPKIVYETVVEEKVKQFAYLRLSGKCVAELRLKADTEFTAHVQFHLNRLPLCESHSAVDQLQDLSLVFPNISTAPNIPWNPHKQWHDKQDSHLNVKQKEAVVAITTEVGVQLPPVLIVGPYGTGKTFTLAQAAKEILRQEGTRVLICTYSNSAADLYIKDYLHPYVEEGHDEAKPLRVYYRQRWVQTVSATVLDYCTLERTPHGSYFIMPSKELVEKHRVVVTTLSTSQYLCSLGLEKDFFTHILVDEAAQAMECQTIMPLGLATKNTRIVLAGDHMQLSPEIHSDFARDRGLHLSLLERLYDLYSGSYPCRILLCENYRSHKAIIDYTSELFYENRLVASGNQPRHDTFYPLTFFTARGEDMHHQNSTAFYNSAEVYEIADRVVEIQKAWPKSWGELDENCIGVVAPYSDQVFRIRAELRKRKMGFISVERVLNVQGKQFRVIFLSTVRTRHTCSGDSAVEDYMDYGFLSNVKLLNTAITRAQSLVAVVGDPISLCSIGKCRKLWERFIELCHHNHSLHGITWSNLRAQLDGVELKKTYVLNPLAPEFVPNRLRHAQTTAPEPVAYGKFGYTFLQPQQPAGQPQMSPNKPGHFVGPPQIPVGVPPPPFPPHFNPHMMNMDTFFLGSPKVQLNGRVKSVAMPQPPRKEHSSMSPQLEPGGTNMSPTGKPSPVATAADTARLFQGSPLGGPSRVVQPLHHLPQAAAATAAAAANRGIKLPYQPYPQHVIGGPYPVPMQYPPMPGFQRLPANRALPFNPFLGAPLGGPRMVIPNPNMPHAGHPFPEELTYQAHVQKVGAQPVPSPANHSNGRGSSQSPSVSVSDSGKGSPQLQFLPSACNVYNYVPTSSSSPMMLPTSTAAHSKVEGSGWHQPNGSRLPVLGQSLEEQLLLRNPHLQRELHSYILQTEGEDKAGAFMHLLQQSSQQLHSAANMSLLQAMPPRPHPSLHMVPPYPPPPQQAPARFNDFLGVTDNNMPKKESVTVSVKLDDSSRSTSRESVSSFSALDGSDMSSRSSNSGRDAQSHDRRGDASAQFAHGPQQFGRFLTGPHMPYSMRQQQLAQAAHNQQMMYRQSHGGNAHQDDHHSEDDPYNDMMRLIEDSLEDKASEVELGNIHTGQSSIRIPTIDVAGGSDRPGPLYMRRSGQSSATNPHLSYAGALRSQPQSGSTTPQGDGPGSLTPATPHTPGVNPGGNPGEIPGESPFFRGEAMEQPDPLELLKNLNIKASPGTQALYQYFS